MAVIETINRQIFPLNNISSNFAPDKNHLNIEIMEYIINETSASQYAWLVWALILGAVLLKPAIKLLLKAWRINKRLHIISFGDNKIYYYDDEYDG